MDQYGDTVEMTYIDVSDDAVNDYPEVKPHLDHPGTPLPIVALDGEPKWAGAISYHHIVKELQSLGVA